MNVQNPIILPLTLDRKAPSFMLYCSGEEYRELDENEKHNLFLKKEWQNLPLLIGKPLNPLTKYSPLLFGTTIIHPGSIKYQPHTPKSYIEVTRRILNLSSVEKLFPKDEKTKQNTTELIQALKKGNWESQIFSNSNYPFYALAALKTEQISVHQFGTALLLWATKYQQKASYIKVIPLFVDGEPNPKAKAYIKETLVTSYSRTKILSSNKEIEGDPLNAEPILRKSFNYTSIDKESDEKEASDVEDWKLDPTHKYYKNEIKNYKFKFLNKSFLTCFFYQMKTQPESEQHFFVIPNIVTKPSEEEDEETRHTITEEIREITEINFFGRLTKSNERIVPSIAMMQIFLNVVYEKRAVKINPVIGISSLADIRRNGLEDTRDMGLQFPGITLPEKADSYLAPDIDFSYHDWYHAILTSGLLPESRRKVISIADGVEQFLAANGLLKHTHLVAFHSGLIDMEFYKFRPDNRVDRPGSSEFNLFWESLADRFTDLFPYKSKISSFSPPLEYFNISEKTKMALFKTVVKETLKAGIPKSALDESYEILFQIKLKSKISSFYNAYSGFNKSVFPKMVSFENLTEKECINVAQQQIQFLKEDLVDDPLFLMKNIADNL